MMYLRAWIKDGAVTHVHCCTRPITRNVIEVQADAVVWAEARDDYEDAAKVRAKLAWHNGRLTGLDFAAQGIVDA